jgi:8-oxo-dGTP pyrophosphatase MutT (NUDIX family)
MTDLEILSRRNDFLRLVVEKLGDSRIDFCETLDFIREPARTGERWQAAGVLLPLFFKEKICHSGEGEFVFKLMKRSSEVVQGGDISCPGGMFHKFADPLFRTFIAAGFPPVIEGKALSYAKQRGKGEFKSVTLFLANAVRESWEELRLSPFNVQYLGPLPCRPLIAFTRIIFPLAGFVKREWKPRTNREVEKILDLPLKDFFDQENYGLYTIETEYKLRDNISGARHFPCFIVRDAYENEEILWGATFSIVMSFLKIVFNFELPDLNGNRTLKKVLAPEYLTGNQKK